MKIPDNELRLRHLNFSKDITEFCSSCGDDICIGQSKCNLNDKECEIHLIASPGSTPFIVKVFDSESRELVDEKSFYSDNKTAIYLRTVFGFTCA